MSFEPVHVWCNYGFVDWASAFLTALLFAPPTILLALRQCSAGSDSPSPSRKVALGLWASCAVVLLVRTGRLSEVASIAVLYAGFAAFAAMLGVRVYRRCVGE